MTTDNNNKSTFGTISIPVATGDSNIRYNLPNTNATTTYVPNIELKWKEPYRVDIIEYDDSIEMIYKQEGVDYSKTYLLDYPPNPPEYFTRVFKIVYSCVDGKWNVSEPIYGKIIPATEETYEFED